MSRKPLRAAAAATLAAAALAWTPAAGAAPAGGARADHVEVKAAATTKAESRRVVDYWTPARMRNAVPRRPPRRRPVHPRNRRDGQARHPHGRRPAGQAEQPGRRRGRHRWLLHRRGHDRADHRQGVLPFGGTNYVCSGSSTTSSNHDVVLTAGHCVNEGPGAYATNWAFVPAYDDGARPYGTFTARALVTTSQWAGAGDFDYDVGLAVVNPVNGTDLTDTVGCQGIGFNLARNQQMYSFGYPAARPNDGTDIAYCVDTVFADAFGGSQDQGMDCT